MMNYTVLQYHMSHAVADSINELGWEKAIELHPEVKIGREVRFGGSEGFSSWMSKYYVPVAHIDAVSLDGVFHIGNVGPENKIDRIGNRMHCVSVGDIIRDNKTGTYHMVDCIGFTQLLSFID
jgi:hypothetical protein